MRPAKVIAVVEKTKTLHVSHVVQELSLNQFMAICSILFINRIFSFGLNESHLTLLVQSYKMFFCKATAENSVRVQIWLVCGSHQFTKELTAFPEIYIGVVVSQAYNYWQRWKIMTSYHTPNYRYHLAMFGGCWSGLVSRSPDFNTVSWLVH